MEKISKDEWLINLVKETQKEPLCTQPEMDARELMMEKFGISDNWAYECIRMIVKRHENLIFEKVWVEFGDGKKHLCQQIRLVQ